MQFPIHSRLILAAALAAAAPLLPAADVSPEVLARLTASQASRVLEARERLGNHYAARLAIFLDQTPQVEPGGVVFVGDSITEAFPLEIAYPGQNVIDRGISGDKVNGVRERLDVSVRELEPSAIYLMIGINNITWGQDPSIEVIGEDYGRLLEEMIDAASGATIHVQSTLPVRTQWPNDNANARALNDIVRGHCERLGLDYIDLWPRMADASGELRAEFTGDGVHLTLAGYEAWLEAISTPDELFAIAQAIAPRWRETIGNGHAINDQDPHGDSEFGGGRGEDQLIVYTPDYGHETTGTNQWGTEATVIDGVVDHVGGNDSPIPANGFIISGHGTSAQWISSTLLPGTRVILEGRTVRIESPPEEELDGPIRLSQLVSRLIAALPELSSQQDLDEAREVLGLLQEMRGDPANANPEAVASVAERLAALIPTTE